MSKAVFYINFEQLCNLMKNQDNAKLFKKIFYEQYLDESIQEYTREIARDAFYSASKLFKEKRGS